jgi:hypothetical protein
MNIYVRTYYSYEHMNICTHTIHMSTSERLSRFDLDIHEVGHQERLIVDMNTTSH